MPQMQDRSFDLLTYSPESYHYIHYRLPLSSKMNFFTLFYHLSQGSIAKITKQFITDMKHTQNRLLYHLTVSNLPSTILLTTNLHTDTFAVTLHPSLTNIPRRCVIVCPTVQCIQSDSDSDSEDDIHVEISFVVD